MASQGGFSIEDLKVSIGSPARPYLWRIECDFLGGLGGAVDVRAQTAALPSTGTTDIELYHQGQKALFAGAQEYEHTWTLTVAETDSEKLTYPILYAWKQSCVTQHSSGAGNMGLNGHPNDYKDNIKISMLASINGEPWHEIVLIGAYIKSIDSLDIDRSQNTEAIKWSVQFNFDRWEYVTGETKAGTVKKTLGVDGSDPVLGKLDKETFENA